MNCPATCPCCGSSNLKGLITRSKIPVFQNLLMTDPQVAQNVDRGDLELALCNRCEFIFNRCFEPSKVIYTKYYENSQAHSPAFLTYLNELADHLLYEHKIQNCKIVEVGCGDGTFLRKLVEQKEMKNQAWGFDPSYSGPTSVLGGRLTFQKSLYGPEYANLPADVVICRHVIEHISEPLALLRSIRKALIQSPNARFFLETPSVEWILENKSFFDLFYEHCSYFSIDSLGYALMASGFEVKRINALFGGQYFWAEAMPGVEKKLVSSRKKVSLLVDPFLEADRKMQEFWHRKLQRLVSLGNVAVWGAGAKGATFANIMDSEHRFISCIVDLNPQKQNYFIPGTGHKIVDYRSMDDFKVKTAIVMNPNYLEENKALLKEADLPVNLVNVMQFEE